jgi:ribonuclease HI
MTDTIILKFDGGSRGNPGIAGAGAVIYKNDIEIACIIIGLDEPSTNNQAEYTGLIEGLKLSLECGYKNIVAYGDSLLVVNHVTRVWKCKSPLLKPLLEEATNIIKQFDSFEIRHIYRKDNSRADELANEAMDNISINLKD